MDESNMMFNMIQNMFNMKFKVIILNRPDVIKYSMFLE